MPAPGSYGRYRRRVQLRLAVRVLLITVSQAVRRSAAGTLPVMQQVRDEARRRKVDLVILPTAQAIGVLVQARAHTNAVLHLTC